MMNSLMSIIRFTFMTRLKSKTFLVVSLLFLPYYHRSVQRASADQHVDSGKAAGYDRCCTAHPEIVQELPNILRRMQEQPAYRSSNQRAARAGGARNSRRRSIVGYLQFL